MLSVAIKNVSSTENSQIDFFPIPASFNKSYTEEKEKHIVFTPLLIWFIFLIKHPLVYHNLQHQYLSRLRYISDKVQPVVFSFLTEGDLTQIYLVWSCMVLYGPV